MTLVLASASSVRAKLLNDAGVSFRVVPAAIDEDALKRNLPHLAGEALAMALAKAKALSVSVTDQTSLIIGCDQILVADGARFDKPKTIAAAREQLSHLRGRAHQLVSAVALARNSAVLWSSAETADLTMRDFSSDFLDGYVATQGDDLLTSVGGYKLEGRGVQLFERITGDYFTILGLPLLALLRQLRTMGVLQT